MEFVEWLLPTTEKFPKKVRLTLSNRIDNLALDVAMTLTEAQYTKSPANAIRQANLLLTKLRILLRLSHTLAFLPHKQYEHASRKIDEVGRMIGAWGKGEF
ncbi:MAG TPA: diversity-generating retroelement protein Avd [Candidatus Hydrogenedentes bacterium]|nr:diversity-generating retroelement protein Avd [Candidatus Hydrogenedentota bacterium]HPG68430.1 diversity-generating retroelement protein Avd [Candidatus Hydrogenedentota bacterium]